MYKQEVSMPMRSKPRKPPIAVNDEIIKLLLYTSYEVPKLIGSIIL